MWSKIKTEYSKSNSFQKVAIWMGVSCLVALTVLLPVVVIAFVALLAVIFGLGAIAEFITRLCQ